MVMSSFVGVESRDSSLVEMSLIGISGIVVSLCDASRIDCSLSDTLSLTKLPYVSVTTNTSRISLCSLVFAIACGLVWLYSDGRENWSKEWFRR